MKNRIISLCLAALMLISCLPLTVFAAVAEDSVISRFTDYSKQFAVTVSEQKRNEEGREKDAYYQWLLEPTTFAINQGDGPWKVGAIAASTGVFSPYTRLLFMCNDTAGGHDLQWASTEEQYLKRVERYMEYWSMDPVGPAGGVQLWEGGTPLWKYQAGVEESLHSQISSLGTELYAAIVYTAEKDGYFGFAVDHYQAVANDQYFAILLDGEMIWPTEGGNLANIAHWFHGSTSANESTVNAALASANGTELKKGQQVAFAVRGGDIGTDLQPVITEYIPGDTLVNIVDTYGTNGKVLTLPAGSEYTIPAYQGDLIFMGWDANGDGAPDYEDGATVTVPALPRFTLTAIVVTPALFGENKPTIEGGNVVFHGGWTVGRYEPASGEYLPFEDNNGSHIYTPGTGGMWGATGGGFYAGSDRYGLIAMSGCTADDAFVSQIRYAVEYNGKVNIDFTKLILGRYVNAGTDPSHLSYNLAIYKNNEKIWPTDAEWYNYTSTELYSEVTTSYDLLTVLHQAGAFPMNVEVSMGDVFDFRVQSGNADCYMYYSEPSLIYTEVYATPSISASNVVLGSDSISLNAYVNVVGASGNTTAGLLYWTEAQTKYDPATGTDFGEGVADGQATVFTYSNIAAKELADILYVMPYATEEDGLTVYGKVTELSVAEYAKTALMSNVLDDASRDLLIALLNYGAEAQNFFQYNLNNLANSCLSKEESKVEKITDAANVYAQTGDGQKIKSVSLICGSEIGFKFMTDAVAGATSYVLEIADNAEFTDATSVDMVATEIGDEYKAIVSIGNTKMAETYYIRVVVDGTAGATLTYSVESYLARNFDTIDNTLYYLMLSMVAYGRACAA